MPLFYFHLNDGKKMILDDVGRELPDRNTARQEAIKDIADIRIGRFEMIAHQWTGWSLTICDHDGHPLETLAFIEN
jgi:hypothetical protein